MVEIPELKDVELILNGEDIAVLMILSCENVVTGLSILLSILQRRGIPEDDPEYVKLSKDYAEYTERLEVALKIQDKLLEIRNKKTQTIIPDEDVAYN